MSEAVIHLENIKQEIEAMQYQGFNKDYPDVWLAVRMMEQWCEKALRQCREFQTEKV